MCFSLRSINTHVTLRSSNINFGHSGEGYVGKAKDYGDQSGMMGFSYGLDEGPVMVRKDIIIL